MLLLLLFANVHFVLLGERVVLWTLAALRQTAVAQRVGVTPGGYELVLAGLGLRCLVVLDGGMPVAGEILLLLKLLFGAVREVHQLLLGGWRGLLSLVKILLRDLGGIV